MFKKFKPVTPGTRQLVLPAFDELTTKGDLQEKRRPRSGFRGRDGFQSRGREGFQGREGRGSREGREGREGFQPRGRAGAQSRDREDSPVRDRGSRQSLRPNKKLSFFKKSSGGRDNLGHISCRHRGGGAKRLYRIVDFKRNKDGIEAKVVSVEYDPNRSAYIALLSYADGEKRYILAPKGIKRGDEVISGEGSPFKVGCCMTLKSMPLGLSVHNIEMRPFSGGKLVRSAGLAAQIIAKSSGYVTLKMPSGEFRMINEGCRATIGEVSNSDHNLCVDGKAGRKRWKGIRPTVRGTAMNPVDHPHGGGEGRHNGYIPRTPWGKVTKGLKTRDKRKSNKWIVKDRRK